MARFLLVHGSNHGRWCWRDLVPELAARRHEPAAVDLPSVSLDPASLTHVCLDDDARAIVSAEISAPSAYPFSFANATIWERFMGVNVAFGNAASISST